MLSRYTLVLSRLRYAYSCSVYSKTTSTMDWNEAIKRGVMLTSTQTTAPVTLETIAEDLAACMRDVPAEHVQTLSVLVYSELILNKKIKFLT